MTAATHAAPQDIAQARHTTTVSDPATPIDTELEAIPDDNSVISNKSNATVVIIYQCLIPPLDIILSV